MRAEFVRSSTSFLFLILLGTACGRDWPQYRGPNNNGVSQDRILKVFPAEGPREVWRVPCANGLSSFAVSQDLAITQLARRLPSGLREVCVAFDVRTGAETWAAEIGPARYDGSVGDDDGPRSTPTIHAGSVYVLSSQLVLVRLRLTDGAEVWSKDLKTLYTASIIGWQSAASPVIDSGLVFIHCNSLLEPVLALRASDGEPQWRARGDRMTHSTPVVATIDGVRQVIFATQMGLVSYDTSSGLQLWKETYPFSYSTSLAASPLVAGNVVFVTGAYSMQGLAVRVQNGAGGWTVTPLWINKDFRAHWMSPVPYEGHIYGLSGSSTTSSLKCLDLATGQEQWSRSGFGRGGVLLADGVLLVLSEKGDLVLIEPSPAGYRETGRATIFPGYDPNRNKCWNVPAIADGRVYARSTAEAVCLDLAAPGPLRISDFKITDAGLFLRVSTDSGAALDTSRLQNLQVRTTTDPSLPLDQWSTAAFEAEPDGYLHVHDTGSTNSRFFVVTEAL